MNEEDIQKNSNPSPSHCIYYLCIDTSIQMPIATTDHSINALRKLIDVDGLRHFSDLTLYIYCEWGETAPNDTNTGLTLPSLFLAESLKKCPHFKKVHLTDFIQEHENKVYNIRL
jgi:hypothetical protein